MPRIVRRKARVGLTPEERDIATCPLYGLSPDLLAETFSMEARLAARWKADLRRVPQRARNIQMYVNRDLGAFDSRWGGFRIVGDSLYTPEGYPVAAAEIRAVPFFHSQLAAERAALRAAERRLEQLTHAKPFTAGDRTEVEGLLMRAIETLRQR